jgi:hypothetical protein
MDTWGCLPGVKRPGREADHFPLSAAEVKNDRVAPPPLRLYGVLLHYLSTGTIVPLILLC